MPTTIIIYNGKYTAKESCSDMHVFFEQYVQQQCDDTLKVFSTKFEDRSRLENIMKEQDKKIFVIPGGSAVYMGRALKHNHGTIQFLKEHNEPIPDADFAWKIKHWIDDGTAHYFGVCAGANLAGESLEFYKLRPYDYEIREKSWLEPSYHPETAPSYQFAERYFSTLGGDNDCLLNLCSEFTPVANYYNHYLDKGQPKNKLYTPYSIQCDFTGDLRATQNEPSFNYLYVIGTGFIPNKETNDKSEFKVGAKYKRSATNNPYRFFNKGQSIHDNVEDLAAVIYKPMSESNGAVCLTGFHPEATIEHSAMMKAFAIDNIKPPLVPLDKESLKQLDTSREQSCNKAVEMVKTTFKI